MKVQDIFTRDAKTCAPEDNLATAASIMWKNDCGVIPVIDTSRKVVGILTDRDICMAAATRDRRASEIRVNEVMSTQVSSCTTNDDVRKALGTMRSEQIRRLPVVDSGGRLQGILSINDVVRAAREGKHAGAGEPTYDDLVAAFKSICAPRTKAGRRIEEEVSAGRWD